jgi:hypothetical protein
MEVITISKKEYLALLNVVEESDRLIHELTKKEPNILDTSIAIVKTISSFGSWNFARQSAPPTTNVFNGNN